MTTDHFKLLKLIVTTNTRSAVVDGVVDLYHGDSVKLYVKGLPRVDLGSLRADLYPRAPATGVLARVLPGSFALVPGRPHDFYATLDLFTDEIKAYLSEAEAGVPKLVQLHVSDAYGVCVDLTLDVYPNPQLAEEPANPVPTDPYVKESELVTALGQYLLTADSIDKAALNTAAHLVSAMPKLSPAQSEARVDALIAALITATGG